jgi:hypothetical protein
MDQNENLCGPRDVDASSRFVAVLKAQFYCLGIAAEVSFDRNRVQTLITHIGGKAYDSQSIAPKSALDVLLIIH